MSKKKFEVMENETIEQCLIRIHQEGYVPVKRMEEPIFKEIVINGKLDVEVCGRKIAFIGQKNSLE